MQTTMLFLAIFAATSTNGICALDVEAMVNDSAVISCSPNASVDIQWHFNSLNTSIYAGDQFDAAHKDRFSLEVDNTTGTHNLIITGVNPDDAGVYYCSSQDTAQVISETHLTVLYSNPVCSVSMPPDGFVGPNTCSIEQENIIFTCAVSFNGKHPQLTLAYKLNDSQPISSSICENHPNRINCSLTMMADPSFDGWIPVCHTGASKVIGHSCTTEVVKVNYVLTNIEAAEKQLYENASCGVESNLNVSYKWTFGQDTHNPLSSDRTILLQRPGIHVCEAEYNIRNVTCVVSASNVSVGAVDKETDRGSGSGNQDQGLIEPPQNLAVYVGQRMSFVCQPPNGSFIREWLFRSVRTNSANDNMKIFTRWGLGKNSKSTPSKYGAVVTDQGVVELYLNETEIDDAGEYTCVTESASKIVSYHADLIVLESEPECNVTEFVDHRIKVGCSVMYSGRKTPKMEWRHRTSGKAFDEGLLLGGTDITSFSNTTHVISTLNALIVGSDKESFIVSCKTFFVAWHIGNGKLQASNVPEFIYIWNSTVFGTPASTLKPGDTANIHPTPSLMTSLPKTDVATQASKDGSGKEDLKLMYIVAALALALIVVMVGTLTYVIRKKKKRTSMKPVEEQVKDPYYRGMSGLYDTIQYDGLGYEIPDHAYSTDGVTRGYETPGGVLVGQRSANGYEDPYKLCEDEEGDGVILHSQYITTSTDSNKCVVEVDGEHMVLSSQYITTLGDPDNGTAAETSSADGNSQAKANDYTPLYGIVGPRRKDAEKNTSTDKKPPGSYIELIGDDEDGNKECPAMKQAASSEDGSDGESKPPAGSNGYTQLLPNTGYTPLVAE